MIIVLLYQVNHIYNKYNQNKLVDFFFIFGVIFLDGCLVSSFLLGDRLVSVNGYLIGGKCNKDVEQLIKDW